MKKINVESKNKEFISILNTQFNGKLNLARIKLMSMFICALYKVQTVGFEKLANTFDTKAKSYSSHRRIQRFITEFILDSDLIAQLIFSLLPEKNNLKLSIDRTNWKFGQTNINILMLGVTYKGVAFPLLFSMLNKRGNSNCQERIDCILADREFVGEEWINYQNNNCISCFIRIRNNFKIFLPHKNKVIKASLLFSSLKLNQFIHYHKIIQLGTQQCYLSGSKVKDKKGSVEFLIIVSFNKAEQAQLNYKER